MSTDTTHNGWANRETWCIALHLDNTEWMHATACEMASPRNLYAENYAGTIREWVEEAHALIFYPVPGDPEIAPEVRAMLADVGSLYRVDWDEIEQYFADKAREIAADEQGED